MRVFLRSEANFVISSISSSDSAQLKNARFFSNGEDIGFESKEERTRRTSVRHSGLHWMASVPTMKDGGSRLHWMVSVSRLGKSGG